MSRPLCNLPAALQSIDALPSQKHKLQLFLRFAVHQVSRNPDISENTLKQIFQDQHPLSPCSYTNLNNGIMMIIHWSSLKHSATSGAPLQLMSLYERLAASRFLGCSCISNIGPSMHAMVHCSSGSLN